MRDAGVEDCGVTDAQAWAGEGWVTTWAGEVGICTSQSLIVGDLPL